MQESGKHHCIFKILFLSGEIKNFGVNNIGANWQLCPFIIQAIPVPVSIDRHRAIGYQYPNRPARSIKYGNIRDITGLGYMISDSGNVVAAIIVR